ncbi:YfhO family protein [Enterococcus sp. LJL120]
MLASFLLPFLILAGVYLSIGIYPGSSRSILASDAFSQSSNFYASFNNFLHGEQSFFYTWNTSLGLNYLSLVSYYLGGIFTFLVYFFPNQLVPDALYLITLIKIGAAGLSFWFLANHSFKLPKWNKVSLAVAYALMSFATAHSELIMWSDAFVYLPLVILGIHKVMDEKKPLLLFVSYLLLFLSGFYMGFMIAIFSGLYFIARLLTKPKTYLKTIIPYGLTAGLATGASLIMILPAVLDLRTNGESLSTINQLKTEATGWWDILMKNMIGVYDTTRYGSIPFIYVGLVPLVFCVFYFVTRKISWKNKVAFGSLLAILIASFYLVPLNLFWHGMHAPNMFLFRYAYLFSFLVVLLAGYGWEQFTKKDSYLVMGLSLLIAALFCIGFGLETNNYPYVSLFSLIISVAFLLFYTLGIALFQSNKLTLKRLSIIFLILMSGEALLNTNGMIHGILDDWNYASRSLYTSPYPAIKSLVSESEDLNDNFYRLENLDAVSSNDSLNYGYSGISMFSSIRNRNSSSFLDELGFRSRGTNLNIRYNNNTLLMDSLFGIKYNLSKTTLNKFGFSAIESAGDYTLYENQNALPLAFTTDESIYNVESLVSDNLGTQTNLVNALSGQNLNYFTFYNPIVTSTENTDVTENGNTVTYSEQTNNVAKVINYQVTVSANTQAYISLFPTDFNQIGSSTAEVFVNGESRKSQINITGQYYDLGYYAEQTTVNFSVSFYGTDAISLLNPQVLGMDTTAYTTAMNAIQANGVELTTDGRTASGNVTVDSDQVLMTTIPFDEGWKAYVDGEEVEITAYEDALVAINLPAGSHEIVFKYLPQGFSLGAISFVVSIFLFAVYLFWLRRRRQQQKLDIPSPLEEMETSTSQLEEPTPPAE